MEFPIAMRKRVSFALDRPLQNHLRTVRHQPTEAFYRRLYVVPTVPECRKEPFCGRTTRCGQRPYANWCNRPLSNSGVWNTHLHNSFLCLHSGSFPPLFVEVTSLPFYMVLPRSHVVADFDFSFTILPTIETAVVNYSFSAITDKTSDPVNLSIAVSARLR